MSNRQDQEKQSSMQQQHQHRTRVADTIWSASMEAKRAKARRDMSLVCFVFGGLVTLGAILERSRMNMNAAGSKGTTVAIGSEQVDLYYLCIAIAVLCFVVGILFRMYSSTDNKHIRLMNSLSQRQRHLFLGTPQKENVSHVRSSEDRSLSNRKRRDKDFLDTMNTLQQLRQQQTGSSMKSTPKFAGIMNAAPFASPVGSPLRQGMSPTMNKGVGGSPLVGVQQQYSSPRYNMMDSPQFVSSPARMLSTGVSSPQRFIDDESAYRLLQDLKIDWLSMSPVSAFIDEWTEDIRKALYNHIKNVVIATFDRNNQQLTQNFGDLFPQDLLAYENQDSVHDAAFDHAVSRATQICSQARFAQAQMTLRQLVMERKEAQRYVSVSRQSTRFPRGYVLYRLKMLVSSGPLLPKYSWCQGSSWLGIEWTCEQFPTDAEIIMNIMCVWLDDALRFNERQGTFQSFHYRVASSSSDINALKEERFWGILNTTDMQASLSHTHYKVMELGELWEVRSGRQNVFHAILLLLYSMKRNRVAGIEALERVIGGRSFVIPN